MTDLVGRIKAEFSFLTGNYLLLVITWIIMDIFNEIPSNFFSLYVLELGGTVFGIGLISFFAKITFAMVSIPGGYIADKYGRKKILVLATLGMAFNFLVLAFAPDWRFLLLALIIGNFLRIANPALHAITADSLPPGKRGLGYSIYQLTVDLSSTPAPLVAAFLFARLGFVPGMRIAYVFVSLAYFAATLIRLRLKETIEHVGTVNLRELLLAFPLSIKETLRMMYEIPSSLRYLVLSFNIFSFAGSMHGSYVILYAIADLGLSKSQWSVLLTIQALFTTLLILPIGKVIDMYGGKKMIVLFNVLMIMGLISIAYGNYNVLYLSMPLLGISWSSTNAARRKLTADLTARKMRGKINGLIRFTTLIVGAVGSLIGGYVYENSAHVNIFLISICVIVVGVLIFARLVQEPEVEEI